MYIKIYLRKEESITPYYKKTFAQKFGEEIRVMVVPSIVDDIKSFKLARDIREKIENELTYPGQITVTVIRETRVQEIAK